MCRVKEGVAVSSGADLQNLVTSVILRQTSTFSIDDICKAMVYKLQGSRYEKSAEVRKRCEDTVSILYMTNCLKSAGSEQYKLAMSFPAVGKR